MVFDDARDRITELVPPPADRTTLAGAWHGLMAWSARRRADLEGELPGLEAQTAVVDDECRKRVAELDGVLVDAGLDRDGRPHLTWRSRRGLRAPNSWPRCGGRLRSTTG